MFIFLICILFSVLDKGEDPAKVLKVLYESLADENLQKDLSVTLFNEKIPIKMPKYVFCSFFCLN